jgi:hypothetical protein
MGKKSKTTTTNEPSAYSKGYITPAATALQGSYQANMPQTQAAADSLMGELPGLQQKAFAPDPTLTAANSYEQDVLGGKYLGAQNPYLSGMIDQTGRDVTDRVNSQFGAAGRTGGTQHVQALGRSLADSENNLRYQDYATERAGMGSAAGLAPSLSAAQYNGIAPTLALASTASGLPGQVAGQYASGTGSLLGQYNTSMVTQQKSLGQNLQDLWLAAAASAGNAARAG